jgi:hypothetical protein
LNYLKLASGLQKRKGKRKGNREEFNPCWCYSGRRSCEMCWGVLSWDFTSCRTFTSLLLCFSLATTFLAWLCLVLLCCIV